jgi:ubiquitin-conjugating enzyme E2 O
LSDCNSDRDKCEKHQGESSSFSLPQAAIELFSSIKAGIFQKLGMTSFYGAVSTVPTFEEGNAPDFLDKKDLETCGPETDSHPASTLQSTEDPTPYCEVIPVSLDSNGSDQLKRFDVIDTCSDHHFFNERKGLPISQVIKLTITQVT